MNESVNELVHRLAADSEELAAFVHDYAQEVNGLPYRVREQLNYIWSNLDQVNYDMAELEEILDY